MNPIICTRIPLPEPDLVAEAANYAIADLHEALGAVQGRMALMSPRMRPLLEGRRISGAAVTSYNFPGDNLMIHVALNVAQRGQVLVLTNGGGSQGALWGDVACTFAAQKGIAGVVADGPVRDVDALRKMNFPVWATAISPSHPEKRGPGSVNVPVVVDGVLVEPGDVIVADGDGVLVIPRTRIAATVEGARQRAAKEVAIRQRIKAGESLFEILNMDAAAKASGIEQIDATWEEIRKGRD
ncbi:MAG: 4-carboxy-4-hydroxy-2-oxoadipate aldolase/oxaloacetate decarboxylase [Hyphomicrobiaceae bacterium]